ncbi:MAG: phosphoribosyl-ATP diphosphatase [Alphaproteobacteria bacterium]|nr:phosphoribosyl-ATP diphosphatase [Alphaproteobacteria bacterium]
MPHSSIIGQLYDIIESRKGENPETSYTAKLLAGGAPLIARKLGEEALETVIATLSETNGEKRKMEIAKESADIIYHMLVLWAEAGVTPDDVWSILKSRFGVSGIDEKNSR